MKQLPSINLSETLTHIIYEIIKGYPSFYHIDMNRALVCLSSNRRGSRGGIYGKLVPLRFRDGSPLVRHHGKLYRMPPVTCENRDLLYLIYFYMPRFFDLPMEEKVKVIFHELFHISPLFNGDIRRMGEGKAIHGHSRDHYNTHFEHEMSDFIKKIKGTPFTKFLQLNSRELFCYFSRVTGTRMKLPRPLRVDTEQLKN